MTTNWSFRFQVFEFSQFAKMTVLPIDLSKKYWYLAILASLRYVTLPIRQFATRPLLVSFLKYVTSRIFPNPKRVTLYKRIDCFLWSHAYFWRNDTFFDARKEWTLGKVTLRRSDASVAKKRVSGFLKVRTFF